MKILFLTSTEEDYLSDALLLGMRALHGSGCVDFPRRDILYADCPESAKERVRGNGFTLYGGLLPELEVDRSHVRQKLGQAFFDLVVVSDIWRQWGLFQQWREVLAPSRTILCDGADSAQVYPHAGTWWRRPSRWLLPRATCGFLYFKREWTEDSRFNLWHRLLPRAIRKRLPHHRGLRRTAFSIPAAKILRVPTSKAKDFALHIVDPEVRTGVPGSSGNYAFSSEIVYYRDLQASRFGITTRRAGWDCLRHYEIAANGCVPCFRNLRDKPATCAPHGLVAGTNCLDYDSWTDLQAQVSSLPVDVYGALAVNALAWARANSCEARAAGVISVWREWAASRLGE